MPSHFEKRYGTGKFEMVEVRNMESEGCFETAIKGVFQAAVRSRAAVGTIKHRDH